MSDSLNGMATTSPPYKIYITNDGWRSYKMLEHPWYSVGLEAPGKYCFFFDSLNFLVYFYVRREGYRVTGIARTTDGGATWNEFLIPEPNGISFNFENRNLGWAVGGRSNGKGNQSADIIYKTIDGGFTWEKIYDKENEPVFGLQNIAFRDSLYKIAVGQFGKVLKSSDGGKSWESIFAKYVEDAPVLHITFAGHIALIGSYALGLWRMWEYERSSSIDEKIDIHSEALLYPNPVIDVLNIRFNDYLVNQIEFEIYNSIGERVKKLYFDYTSDEIKIKHPDLLDGVYFYRIKSGDKIFSGSFVKFNQ
ncbi:MAG: T9SS type A sorting domain-containing protein [Candidatus Kapabacteria bacterium]|nr:T9SS type A sorting domain-containing protein [Candidatus Kapabacteria bacterium]